MKHLITISILLSYSVAHGQAISSKLPSITDSTITIDTNLVKRIKIGNKTVSLSNFGKSDTIAVPVYIVDHIDTTKALTTIIYQGKGNRLYQTKGYYIYTQKMATSDFKHFQPFSDPITIGALDDKMKKINVLLNK